MKAIEAFLERSMAYRHSPILAHLFQCRRLSKSFTIYISSHLDMT